MAPPAPTLLVLAAGMGRRFGGAKQFEPIGPNGEALLDYAVFDAFRAGFQRVVFVVGEDRGDALVADVEARYRAALRVDCVQQRLDDLPAGCSVPASRVKPWGTLHAVLAARDAVHEPFAVINADDFYGRDAFHRVVDFFSKSHHGAGRDRCCMVAYALDRTLSGHGGVNRGICVDDGSGMLVGVEEHSDLVDGADGHCRGVNSHGERVEISRRACVSMNFWGFSPAFFEPLQQHFVAFLGKHGNDCEAECYLPSAIDTLLRSGRVDCRILTTEAQWFGMTRPQDKPECAGNVRALIAAGAYPSVLRP